MASRWAEFLGDDYMTTHGKFAPLANWGKALELAYNERGFGVDLDNNRPYQWDSVADLPASLGMDVGWCFVDPTAPLDISNIDKSILQGGYSTLPNPVSPAGVSRNLLSGTRAAELAGYSALPASFSKFGTCGHEYLWQIKRMLDACYIKSLPFEVRPQQNTQNTANSLVASGHIDGFGTPDWPDYIERGFHYAERTSRTRRENTYKEAWVGNEIRYHSDFGYVHNVNPLLSAKFTVKCPLSNVSVSGYGFWHPQGDIDFLPLATNDWIQLVGDDWQSVIVGDGNGPAPDSDWTTAAAYMCPDNTGWHARWGFVLMDISVPGGLEFYDPLD